MRTDKLHPNPGHKDMIFMLSELLATVSEKQHTWCSQFYKLDVQPVISSKLYNFVRMKENLFYNSLMTFAIGFGMNGFNECVVLHNALI